MTAPERILVATYSGKTHSGYWGVDDVSLGPKTYILATPEALAASPEVQALIADAVARGMERAADHITDQAKQIDADEDEAATWGGPDPRGRDVEALMRGQAKRFRIEALAVRAEAAAIRDGHKPGE